MTMIFASVSAWQVRRNALVVNLFLKNYERVGD